jgi:hypothetical protein
VKKQLCTELGKKHVWTGDLSHLGFGKGFRACRECDHIADRLERAQIFFAERTSKRSLP